MSDWTTLVAAEDLAAALGRDDLIVIDTRTSLSDRAASEQAYRDAHIPGARYADLDRDLSDHRKPGGGRHPWPDAADFVATLGRWGVTPQHQVVVYDAADGALAASRLWFLLRVLGHRRVAVLDGGWQRWSALGLPTDAELPAPQPTRYEADYDACRLLDAQQVRSLLDSGGLLIDARAGERFRGEVEPLDKVAGHVPGAVNLPHRKLIASKLAGYPPQTLFVVYCAGPHCNGAARAAGRLAALQRPVKLMAGGVTGWLDEGFALARAADATA